MVYTSQELKELLELRWSALSTMTYEDLMDLRVDNLQLFNGVYLPDFKLWPHSMTRILLRLDPRDPFITMGKTGALFLFLIGNGCPLLHAATWFILYTALAPLETKDQVASNRISLLTQTYGRIVSGNAALMTYYDVDNQEERSIEDSPYPLTEG